ncbi:hypothetical protein TEA_005491 [Camellia sinensis var. sinensis]|uniref:Uncharacterized protein n=1 Tax=Camellia sinensis var. sinensis TaxID=542762 RepID=A0A4S4EFE4_CAMSN|nr:hypothetical protein TEA_005491 [Camellia sinensis var. sinensis]
MLGIVVAAYDRSGCLFRDVTASLVANLGTFLILFLLNFIIGILILFHFIYGYRTHESVDRITGNKFLRFAAEDFHGLQEQVMSTSSRSHKMVVRVQHIEAALAPLEVIIGILISKMSKITLFTVTCQTLLWIPMKNVVIHHVFKCNPLEYAMISSHIDIGAYC